MEKAPLPMLVTELGKVTEGSFWQPAKALFPILIRPSGKVMEGKLKQPEKAESPIFVTVFGIKELMQPTIKVLETVSIKVFEFSLES